MKTTLPVIAMVLEEKLLVSEPAFTSYEDEFARLLSKVRRMPLII
jgi:hypothetical protein